MPDDEKLYPEPTLWIDAGPGLTRVRVGNGWIYRTVVHNDRGIAVSTVFVTDEQLGEG